MAERKRKAGRGRAALRRADKLSSTDGPVRTCIVCRSSGQTEAFLRFARAPDGAVGFDVAEKLPGRGAWLCAKASCLDKATDVKHGGFARAFDAAVVFDGKALRDDVRATLRARVVERLGLARRRGALVLGREAALQEQPKLVAIGLAADLSQNSRDELTERATVPLVTLPTMAELTAAVGHDREVGVVGIVGDASLLSAVTRWQAV